MRDITRRTKTVGSMSFRLKWISKLDEDVYMYIIASSFGLIFCHTTSSNVCHIRYQLDIKFSLFFFFNILITHNHKLKMATEKRTLLFSHLLIYCLTAVVDPWYLQSFADPLPL